MLLLYLTFTFFHLASGQVIENDTFLNCKYPHHIDFCIDESYDKTLLPPLEHPLVVRMSGSIKEVSSVNDLTLTVTVRLNIYMQWTDSRIKRLTFDPYYKVISPEIVETLFIPDIYIYDLLRYKPFKIVGMYKGLWLSKHGTLVFYLEGLFEIACPMRFDKYPFDNQVCKLQIGSTKYNTDQIVFHKLHFSTSTLERIQRPLQYKVEIVKLKWEDIKSYDTGDFSVVGVKMYLWRKPVGHILQIYMPSSMFILVSWISFILPYDGGERVSLLVTLFLVLVSMFLSVVNSSPKARTMTAVEYWVLACMVFVFMALLELGYIMHLVYRATERNVLDTYTQQSGGGTVDLPTAYQKIEAKENKNIAKKIDGRALIIMPCLFAVYNSLYWFNFLYVIPSEIDLDKNNEAWNEKYLQQPNNDTIY